MRLVAAGSARGQLDPPQIPPRPRPEQLPIDGPTREVLAKINAADAYSVPKLDLKRDPIYAHTSQDVEPFRQRAALQAALPVADGIHGPRPGDPRAGGLDTVKIGFVGPIMATVSVATGGKSHEEVLGKKMLQGAQLAIEQANAARRLPEAQDPL